jgi:lysophospholipase L1-like esterase
MRKLKIVFVVALCFGLMGFTFLPNYKILFVGDSLTTYKGGWQNQYSKMRGAADYVNISKGGKRTKWMLEQMKKYPADKYEYSPYHEIVIYGGINDSFSYVSEDETIYNIQQMIYIAKKMGALPIVVIGYDPNKVIKNTMYSNEVETRCRNRYIKLQKRMVKDLKWCIIVPMDTTITRADSDDGIHLKSSGHKKFSKWVSNELK